MDRSSPAHADPPGGDRLGADAPSVPSGRARARAYAALGIDVGSVNVKVCGLAGASVWHAVIAHEGDVEAALERALGDLALDRSASPLTLATGGAGRRRIDVSDAIAPLAIEAALQALALRPRAVVSLGGEDLVVHILDGSGRVQTSHAGNKCASGTGEFFRQQLGRMDLDLAGLDEVTEGARVLKLSARCSVFMKSDCTHRLNKGEATRGDIALSLSKVMADKVGEFLIKARVRAGQVALVGGVTQNRHLLGFLAEAWPKIEFVVPSEARFFEAFGAAHLARALGRPLPPRGGRLRALPAAAGTPFAPLASAESRVRYFPSRRGALRPGAEYVLGVDGGLDDDQGGARRRRDAGDRRRPLRADPRRSRWPRSSAAWPRSARRSATRGRGSPSPPPPAPRASFSASSWRRTASTTRSSPTPRARPTSSPTSTRSSRSAGRTRSTSCSTTGSPSTTR
jgi:hypothetical protein